MTDTKPQPQPLTLDELDEMLCAAETGTANSDDVIRLIFALEAERAGRLAAEARVAELEKLVYVPGLWRCAKCNFILVQSNLNAANGTVTARDEPGDTCPNCNINLWRVSERQERQDMQVVHEKEFERRLAAEAERDRLREALRPLAVLKVPYKPQGNAGAYSIRFSDIERAHAALAGQEGGNG